jgi:hypothetical protein
MRKVGPKDSFGGDVAGSRTNLGEGRWLPGRGLDVHLVPTPACGRQAPAWERTPPLEETSPMILSFRRRGSKTAWDNRHASGPPSLPIDDLRAKFFA